jgi:hypothetical protein
MQEVLMFATIISPIILAVVQLVKQVNMPKTIVPFLAVVIGVLVGYAAQPFTDLDVVLRLWAGGLAGLSATGLFEFVKTTNGYTKGGDE